MKKDQDEGEFVAIDAQRRSFLKGATVGLAGAWVLGACAPTAPGADLGTPDARDGTSGPDGGVKGDASAPDGSGKFDAASDVAVGTDLPQTCGALTAPNIEGPFFTPNSPERDNLIISGTPGVLLELTGKVLSVGCQPIAGALLDFWQADAQGGYDNVAFAYRGHQFTLADGSYKLSTIIPGRYLNGAQYRPAHIHVKVGAPGSQILTTQLYFEGDPYNAVDPFIHASLIMPLSNGPAGSQRAQFNFVVS